MVRWNSWLQLLWWDFSSFDRDSGRGQQTEGEWQSSCGAHVTATASHRAPCPTRPLWRLETNCSMKGEGVRSLTARNKHFHLSLHSIRDWNVHLRVVSRVQRRSQHGLLGTDMFFQTHPFPWNLTVLQMSNTSSELVSKVSFFQQRPLIFTSSPNYNLCIVTLCFSCLVSMTPGWRSTTLWAKCRKHNLTGSGFKMEN